MSNFGRCFEGSQVRNHSFGVVDKEAAVPIPIKLGVKAFGQSEILKR